MMIEKRTGRYVYNVVYVDQYYFQKSFWISDEIMMILIRINKKKSNIILNLKMFLNNF